MEKGPQLPEVSQTPASRERKEPLTPQCLCEVCLSSGSQASGLAVFPLGPVEVLGTQSLNSEVEKHLVCCWGQGQGQQSIGRMLAGGPWSLSLS